MDKNEAIAEILKHKNTKVFSSNIDALKFCLNLKGKGIMPYKYTIVVWGEDD